MNTVKYVGIMLIAFVYAIGCSGSYQHLKTSPGNDSNMTHQDLIENWSDYEISYRQINGRLVVIVFDPKNDNRKILVESPWRKVSGQETWAEILKTNTTGDGKFSLNGGYHPPTISLRTTGVRDLKSPDNQFFGFIILQERREYVLARMVDVNTMRLAWSPPRSASPAK